MSPTKPKKPTLREQLAEANRRRCELLAELDNEHRSANAALAELANVKDLAAHDIIVLRTWLAVIATVSIVELALIFLT